MPTTECPDLLASENFMDDRTTTLAMLREVLRVFVAERDWSQFHAPKNLAMSLAIEAAELMEHFQWIDAPESRFAKLKDDQLQEIANELADVLAYCLALSLELEIDLSAAFERKMAKNRLKYPADEYRGKF